jgi:hypothetical protein
MKSSAPNPDEIDSIPRPDEMKMFAHLEYLYEKNKFVAPLQIRVTDSAGKIAAYEFQTANEEQPTMARASSVAPKLKLPLTIEIVDAIGTFSKVVLKDLSPLPEWMNIMYPGAGKA